jgi:hypothetical protein
MTLRDDYMKAAIAGLSAAQNENGMLLANHVIARHAAEIADLAAVEGCSLWGHIYEPQAMYCARCGEEAKPHR